MSVQTTSALLLLLAAGISSSQMSNCSYLTLLDHLQLTTANDALSTVRPVKNWTTSTVVNVDMLLYGILEVNQKSQTLTSHIWRQVFWENEFLFWNSSDFCGIDALTLPISKVWTPDIAILEDVSDTGSVQQSPVVTLYSSGMVITNNRQRLTSTCLLNLYSFPFDTQHCNITFSTTSYDGKAMTLDTARSESTLTAISEMLMVTQGEWELLNLTVTHYSVQKSSVSQSKLVFTVSLKRKPLLYVINLIVPLLYFLILDLASFFISGEKLSFKVTVLLSISVLLLILKDMLPSTEEHLPLIAIYCVVVFTLVGLSILEVILVTFLMELDEYCGKEAQKCVDVQEEDQTDAVSHKELPGADEQVKPVAKPGERDLLKLILAEVKAARQESRRQGEDKQKRGRFARLAYVIDIVYFVFYFLTVVVYVLTMFKLWVINNVF